MVLRLMNDPVLSLAGETGSSKIFFEPFNRKICGFR
jgi:hypothetical protein